MARESYILMTLLSELLNLRIKAIDLAKNSNALKITRRGRCGIFDQGAIIERKQHFEPKIYFYRQAQNSPMKSSEIGGEIFPINAKRR
jgi:hypothetical protein